MRAWTGKLILIVTVFLLLAATASRGASQTGKKSKAAKPKAVTGSMLFVVARGPGEVFIDPVVILRPEGLTNLPDAGLDKFSKLEARYFREGKTYRLLFGGGEAGTVMVRKQPANAGDCFGAQAIVGLDMKADTQSKIGGLVMGLATDSAKLGRKLISRRFPTMGERSSVTELARQFYRKKGLTGAQLQNMKPVNITAMDLDKDERAEIIATFSVKNKARTEARHFLFVVAEPDGRDYKLSVARYERVTRDQLPSGASFEDVDEYVLAEVLVDQLDLDGDDKSELITAKKSWEGITYRIYKKQKALWKKLYEVYNYRCAY